MSLPYYKRYPRDFIEGTIGMSLELKGAYGLVLDLIYMQDGALPDDAKYISGLLGCTVRKWNAIRSELLERRKIYVNGEFLSNYRADKERETLRKFQENQAENASKPRKNNNLAKAAAKPARVKPEPEPDTTALKARAGGFKNFEGLSDLLCEAAGLTDETKSPGHLSLADPLRWIENGCDLEADILPAIRSTAAAAKARGTKITSWGYFNDPVFEARDRRLAPAPVAPIRQQSHSRPVSVAEAAMRKVQGQ